ncbi:hypothetical protein N5J77_22835 [Sphingobium yanoikuyae]|jgi:hypothetical protein|uniref:Uncharacterized protein n=2 Tax=Sphingobium TaxID=165695 RepID=A0A9X7YB77_SPHYA|nr:MULTISPECIES: hypothetical protein [Sphingobium]MDF0542863.1 hypothetical protein [Sphingobium arseniciresistens]MBB4150724.1 hypothetical protein [Sphingobium scionense]MDH2133973.1 hypothetical protein [Sphingobium yanoikuyae]MDH2151774.1 hypothetical protein [Sphingobium yanoikuyae]MDH2169325.1 hypothetical protein [Sphingobium yanoikuyae]
MRKIRAAVLAGVAAVAAIGTALAASHNSHVMKVGLPDGTVARIEYQGDVAPKVTVAPASSLAPIAWLDPLEAAPFALFDRIAADMDRQSEMMMRQVHALPLLAMADDGKIDLTALRSLPPGTVSYSFVSTTNGGSACSRSVQVTSLGSGEQPKVVSNSSGDCREAPSATIAHPNRTDALRRT